MTATISTAAPRAAHRVPLLGHLPALLRRRVEFFTELRALGDVVQVDLGPRPAYVVNSPELIRQMMVTDAEKFVRGRFFVKARQVLGNGLITSDGPRHLRQRRIIQPAFAHDRFAAYSEIMRAQADELIHDWQDGQEIRLDLALLDLGITVAGKALINSGIGGDAVTVVRKCLPALLTTVMNRAMLPDALEKLPTPANRKFNESRSLLRDTIDGVIAAYRAQPGHDHGDILSMLTSARYADTGETMPGEQIRDEVLTVLLGGSETSATSMSWIFYELSQHPEVESRLHAEIDEALQGRPITLADIPRLPYLDQVLNETVRRHSPTWLFMRATTEDVKLGGVTIPSGAEVIMSMTALHRDPRLFPDPLVFDPERWADPEMAGVLSPKCAFIPFGAGVHKCIGDHFAWTEMAIVAATVGQHWQLRLPPGVRVKESALTTLRPDHLPVITRSRSAQ